MKQLILLICGIFLFYNAFTQSNQWTWLSGDSYNNALAVYGTKGTAAPANKPGARQYAASWTDLSGNLWLFGGNGYAASGSSDYLNDLWKYTPSTGFWTWVSGGNTVDQNGVYGTRGTSAPGNTPGARSNAVTWRDATGNLWLFGGSGSYVGGTGFFNDLWMFAPSTGLWTWVSGDNVPNQAGVYGTKKVPAGANKPGARYGAAGWSDASGNLWLYSGFGGYTDLWSYNISSGLWTWVNGSNTPSESAAVFGTKGVSDASNKPGARIYGASWTDPSGNFWLFGGNGNVRSTAGFLNDLWKYTPVTDLWTWVGGDSVINQLSVYGTKGTASISNKPGAREGAVGISDVAGNLLLFGGGFYTLNFPRFYNDVWRYNISDGQWTWISNDSTANPVAVYGTKGVGSPDNKPGGKEGASGWTDGLGHLKIFGGTNFNGVYNDLWEYSVPASTLPVRFSSFTARKQQQTVQLNWSTAQEQNSRYFIVERSSNGSDYDSIGMILAIGNSSSLSNYHFIDKTPYPGANYYRLNQKDQDGKSFYSSVIKVSNAKADYLFGVVQNPVQNILQLSLQLPEDQKFTLHIEDMNGKLVVKEEHQGSKGSGVYSIPVDRLKKGVYVIHVTTEGITGAKTFIKQ